MDKKVIDAVYNILNSSHDDIRDALNTILIAYPELKGTVGLNVSFEQNDEKNLSSLSDDPMWKTEKKVFSFRSLADYIKVWRLYASIFGIKVDDLGTLAMNEYLASHPLKDLEKALFDDKMNSKRS